MLLEISTEIRNPFVSCTVIENRPKSNMFQPFRVFCHSALANEVDGIDVNDLHLSLWSGKLELKDVKAML